MALDVYLCAAHEFLHLTQQTKMMASSANFSHKYSVIFLNRDVQQFLEGLHDFIAFFQQCIRAVQSAN